MTKNTEILLCKTDNEEALFVAVETHKYVGERRIEEIKRVIDLDTNVNIKNHFGYTPLMIACIRNCIETAKLLIDAGAYSNAQNDSGRTGLMHASERGSINLVKLLLDIGADPNIEDEDKRTALTYATSKNHSKISTLLKDEIALINAVFDKNIKSIKEIIRRMDRSVAICHCY